MRLAAADVSQASPAIRAALEKAREIMGFIPNDALQMAHNPVLMEAMGGLIGAVYAPGQLSPQLKRLIGLIASATAGSRYCAAHTAHAADKLGVPPEKLADIWHYETSPHYTAAERACLRVAQASVFTPSAVTDADVAAVRAHFGDQGVLEVTAVIAMFGFLNRWNGTLKTDIEPGPLALAQKADIFPHVVGHE
jgi:uncharacterized peroxidase-related enzyme